MPAILSLDPQGFPAADGQPLALPPKERSALALLLQRRPAVVRKEDFAEYAWPGGLLSDEGLARCISRLRRALGPLGLAIESVYGLGYRLVPRDEPPGPGAQVPDPVAVQTTWHARQLAQQRTPAALARAMVLLRELIAGQPLHTPAHVALADCLAAAVGWGQLPTDVAVAEGLNALATAERQDPHTPGLHAMRGALLDAAWRFGEAGAAFDAALRLSPRDPDTLAQHGRHLLLVGDAEGAVRQLRQALALSPHALPLGTTLARALVQAGRGEEAVAQADRVVAEHPGSLLATAFGLAMRAQVAPTPALAAPAWRLIEGADVPPFAWTVLCFVLSRVGAAEAALDIADAALLCSATSAGEATLYAAPLAALGAYDRAAALLRRGCDEGCGMLAMVLRDPANAALVGEQGAARDLVRRVFGNTW